MAESLDPIERLPDNKPSDRVNPADRSNPEKKDNGFSSVLKEKMKEKLKEKALQKDEVILDNEPEQERQSDLHDEQSDASQVEAAETNDESDEQPLEHVDLKA